MDRILEWKKRGQLGKTISGFGAFFALVVILSFYLFFSVSLKGKLTSQTLSLKTTDFGIMGSARTDQLQEDDLLLKRINVKYKDGNVGEVLVFEALVDVLKKKLDSNEVYDALKLLLTEQKDCLYLMYGGQNFNQFKYSLEHQGTPLAPSVATGTTDFNQNKHVFYYFKNGEVKIPLYYTSVYSHYNDGLLNEFKYRINEQEVYFAYYYGKCVYPAS